MFSVTSVVVRTYVTVTVTVCPADRQHRYGTGRLILLVDHGCRGPGCNDILLFALWDRLLHDYS